MNTQRMSHNGFFTGFGRWLVIFLSALLALPLMLSSALAQTFEVTNANDWGVGSLRKAVKFANRTPGPDVIVFNGAAGTVVLDSGPIVVTDPVEIRGPGSDLFIIDAGGQSNILEFSILTNDSNYSLSGISVKNGHVGVSVVDRVEEDVVEGNAVLSISEVVSTNNAAAGIMIVSPMSNNGSEFLVTVDRSEFSNNVGDGLVAYVSSRTGAPLKVDIDNSVFNNNAYAGANFEGGTHYQGDHAASIVKNSLFEGNDIGVRLYYTDVSIYDSDFLSNRVGIDHENYHVDDQYWGPNATVVSANIIDNEEMGIMVSAGSSLALKGSTITGSQTGMDVYSSYESFYYGPSEVLVINSTISGNDYGVDLHVFYSLWYDDGPYDAVVDLRHSTITKNGRGMWVSAWYGYCADGCEPSVLSRFDHLILADNGVGANDDLSVLVAGEDGAEPPIPIIEADFSLFGEDDLSFITVNEQFPGSNLFGVDPLLGPLSDNGGPKLTHMPLTGSPAIDAGSPAFVGPPVVDQRGPGFPRVQGDVIDIGAVEVGTSSPPPPLPGEPTCGMPNFDKATESGFFLWNECGTNLWNIRVTAGGQSLSYLGTLTSDAGFSLMEAFSYEGNDAMPPDFAMHVGNAGQDGLRFGLQEGAQGCVTVNGPAGMPITAGANRVDVGQSVSLPDFGECGSSPPPPPPTDDPTCGMPSFDKATESGFFLWNECGTNVWNARVTAGGQSLSYLGSLTSDAGFSLMEAFSYEGNDAMPPNFAMHVGNAGQDGLRFGLPDGAQGCVTVNGPAGMTITAGANRVDVGQSVSLPDFGECGSSPPPPPPPDEPACGMPSFDKATESGFFLWNECGSNVWHARVTAGGQSLSYVGSLTSSPDFTVMEAFSFEGNDVMPPDFAMHVGNAGQDGLRFIPSQGAAVCLTLDGPADMVITAGSDRVNVGRSVSLPDYGSCSN